MKQLVHLGKLTQIMPKNKPKENEVNLSQTNSTSVLSITTILTICKILGFLRKMISQQEIFSSYLLYRLT